MSLSAVEVADAISELVVDGIKTIRDLDGVPQNIESRDCPMVYPVTDSFMALEDATQITLGPNALWQYTYLLTYRYVHGPVGAERGLSKTFPGHVAGYVAFIQAITRDAQLLGASAHIKPGATSQWGLLGGPSDQDPKFHAADLTLRVVEYSAS
jgi:hypothetical protein